MSFLSGALIHVTSYHPYFLHLNLKRCCELLIPLTSVPSDPRLHTHNSAIPVLHAVAGKSGFRLVSRHRWRRRRRRSRRCHIEGRNCLMDLYLRLTGFLRTKSARASAVGGSAQRHDAGPIWDKTWSFWDIKKSLFHERGNEQSERANKWAVRANKWMDERVAQYLRLDSCLFQTIVRSVGVVGGGGRGKWWELLWHQNGFQRKSKHCS